MNGIRRTKPPDNWLIKILGAFSFVLLISAILPSPPVVAQTLPPAITVVNYPDRSIVDEAVPLELYTKRVLWREWYSSWDEDALKAGAVAIRTWASYPENWRGTDANGNPQVYGDAHGQVYAVGGENIPAVSAAVDATAGQFLTYNNGVINAQYRNENGAYTNPCGWYPAAYLVSIYDPISADATPTLDPCLLAGMGQYGSQRWAIGNSSHTGNSTPFPRWDYPQILAHYYSSVDFRGIYFPHDYRFNVLQAQTPATVPQNDTTTAVLTVQNAGTNTWHFPTNCSETEPDGIALSFHWYNAEGDAVAAFEGSRQMICNASPLVPGSHLEIQGTIYPAASDVALGDYQIKWDMYFNSLNLWASRLDPQGNPYNPLWATYSDFVTVTSSGGPPPPTATPGYDFGPPRNVGVDTGQSTDTWTSNSRFIITWEPPDVSDVTIAGYAYAWDNEPGTIVPARVDTPYWGTDRVLPDGGEQYFHLRAVATDGRAGEVVHLGPFQIDTAPPSNPTYIASTSHITGVWSPQRVIDVTWAGASDDVGSGIAGYSVEWNQSASTFPDETINITTTYISSLELADGLHYFHLRAVDEMGMVDLDAIHLGPFNIDGTPPPIPAQLTSTSHVVNRWSSSAVVHTIWSDASDGAGSGIMGFSILWDTAPTTLPDTSLDTSLTAWDSPALSDGANHYFHVRPVDVAGHWSATAAHLGPFWIDNTPPQNPQQFVSSSHVTQTWSNDNTVQVAWDAASDGTGSGIAGFSILWDTTPDGVPDSFVDTTELQATSSLLSDGANHYAHLRTVDGVGWASNDIAHLGPFWIDTAPPTARVLPLPAYVTDTQFAVAWQGADALSGVRDYDVEYRLKGGSWQTWLMTTSARRATFIGMADQTYEFRARARDEAGNLSSWPDIADVETQVRVHPYLAVAPSQMTILAPLTDSTPQYRAIKIANEGGGQLQWTAISDEAWVTVVPTSGTGTATATAIITSASSLLPLGIYPAHITISAAAETRRSPQILTVTLRVVERVYKTYLPLITDFHR